MPAAPLIIELKALQRERGVASPFSDDLEFQRWADEVLPRLTFDRDMASEFRRCVLRVESGRALQTPVDRAMNDAVGVLNRAVVKLQSKPFSETMDAKPLAPPPLETPQKLTLKWIWDHAPLSFYVSLGSALIAAFGAGAWFSELRNSVVQRGLPAVANSPTPLPAAVSVPAAKKPSTRASAPK